MAKIFVGIDPGIEGAIAVIGGKTDKVFKMPTRKEIVSGKNRNRVNLVKLAVLWDMEVMIYDRADVFAVIEKLSPIAHIGKPKGDKKNASAGFGVATTNFRLGESVGQLHALLSMTEIAHDEIPWRTWAPAFGIPKKDKEMSLHKARQLFPAVKLPNKSDHGKAEALLLAEFGRRLRGAF